VHIIFTIHGCHCSSHAVANTVHIRNYRVFLLAVYCLYIITAIVLRSTVSHSFRLPSFFWNGFLKLYTCKTSGGLISQQHAIIHYSTLPLFNGQPETNTSIRFFSYLVLPHRKGKSTADLHSYIHAVLIACMHTITL
jgi:hypothetical protein